MEIRIILQLIIIVIVAILLINGAFNLIRFYRNSSYLESKEYVCIYKNGCVEQYQNHRNLSCINVSELFDMNLKRLKQWVKSEEKKGVNYNMYRDYYNDNYFYGLLPKYVDLHNQPVKHTPVSNPYSYDEYVIYKSKNYNPDKHYSATYSDRMMQWDITKFGNCHREAFGNDSQMFYNAKPELVEKFLSLYFDKDINLIAILQGCNVSNGNPYWVFIYIESE